MIYSKSRALESSQAPWRMYVHNLIYTQIILSTSDQPIQRPRIPFFLRSGPLELEGVISTVRVDIDLSGAAGNGVGVESVGSLVGEVSVDNL